MSQVTVDQALQIALQHQRNGQLAEAEEVFEQVLAAYPEQADALHLLGGVYLQANHFASAETKVRRAIALRPQEPAFKLTLGVILQSQQKLEEAIQLYQQVVAENPGFAEGHVHLGVALCLQRRFAEAALCYQEALKIAPANAKAQGDLGITLIHLNRHEEAIVMLRGALRLTPKEADYHAALGAALYFKGQLEAAQACCNEAIRLNGDHAHAHNTLSLVLRDLGCAEESVAPARRAAELLPDLVNVQVNYGESLRATDMLDEAETHYRRCVARAPACPDYHNNLANILKDKGLGDEAVIEFRHALSLRMDPAVFSNMLYTMHYLPAWTPQAIAPELQRFDASFIQPLAPQRLPHTNNRDPDRRLRVGYISSEFRQHALGFNLMPLFASHDKTQVEIFCYAGVHRPDFYTYRIRQCADHWTETLGMSDEQIAEQVRRDQIDILIDLHQHMAGNRLLIYGLKPAPVQIAFAGYPGTTGLSTMDYRLTDPYLEPPDMPFQASSEKVLRLPSTWWCYNPVVEVPVTPLPALDNGCVTFGNLNNVCKLNQDVFLLWSKVLHAVENSRLLLLVCEGSARVRIRGFFERLGIAPARINFVARRPTGDYYKLYQQIDLGLDSFPCNGHTTSMDSFFMGVPVVSIIGDRLFGRATWSLVNNLGMPELAGKNEEEFTSIATALARDLPRLAQLRQSLRERMRSSLLMDPIAFTRGIETAYRTAWRTWCKAR